MPATPQLRLDESLKGTAFLNQGGGIGFLYTDIELPGLTSRCFNEWDALGG